MVLPIANRGAFARRIGFAVPFTDIKTRGVVRCDQPPVLNLNARNCRKVDMLRPIRDKVLARTVTLLEQVASAAGTRSTGPPLGCASRAAVENQASVAPGAADACA
jgi:hypothetical protein